MLSFVDENDWFSLVLVLGVGSSLMSEITTSLTLADFLLMDWDKGLVLSAITWEVDGELKIVSMQAAPIHLLSCSLKFEPSR